MAKLTPPEDFPRWATDGGALMSEPASGKQDIGWQEDEFPPADYMNWLHKTAYLWLVYLDSYTKELQTRGGADQDPLLALALGLTPSGFFRREVLGTGSYAGPLVFDGSKLWCFVGDGNVSVRDVNDGSELFAIDLAVTTGAACFDGLSIWVTIPGADQVKRLDLEDGSVIATVAVGDNPQGICFADDEIWVSNKDSDNIKRISIGLGTEAVTATITGAGTDPVALAFDGTHVWVAAMTGGGGGFGTWKSIDVTDNSVDASLDVSSVGPGDMYYFDTLLYCSHISASTEITVINVVAGTKSSVLGIPDAHFAGDGRNVYSSDSFNDVIRVYRHGTTNGGTLDAATRAVGDQPAHIAFDGRYLWVAHANDDLRRIIIE